MTTPSEPEKVRFNEKLDHLEARRPFLYNLATGALVVVPVALFFRIHWLYALLYVVSWACLRSYLWGAGRILRRQYETRLVRVEAHKAGKRRPR